MTTDTPLVTRDARFRPAHQRRCARALPNAGPALIDVVLPRLINELAELSQPVVLVLDDYHLLREPSVHASVAYLLRYMPRTLQLALASRADPPLPLAGLRAAGEVVEVRASELRFDEAEADALLNGSFALGLGADEAHVSGRCGMESYVWKFSNGTTSYGPTPQRTFNAPGRYDGQLTVTDKTGLKATRSFSVNVTA